MTSIAQIAVISERLLELLKLILSKAGIQLPDWSKLLLALVIGFLIFYFKDVIPAGFLPAATAGAGSSYVYAVRRRIEPTS